MIEPLHGYDGGRGKVQLAVFQSSPFCNIDCRYCYLPNRAATHRMSPEVLEQSFAFLFAEPRRLAETLMIAWHSGEPLAMPVDFYERAFELQKYLAPKSIRIENAFQTNAMLIDQTWCNFIKKWDVSIGVSIDGPQWIHDLNRVDRSGRGSFDRVLRGIRLLQSNNIEFKTISVLSLQALQHPDQMWRFFKDLGVGSMAFNFEDIEGVHRTSSLLQTDCFAQAEAFFTRLLELRNNENPDMEIRELDYFFDGFAHWSGEFRRMESVPLCILAIDWQGNISTFSPELLGMQDIRYQDFVLGNVTHDTLDKILAHPKCHAISQEIAHGIARCKDTCDYFYVCGGGVPSSKLYQNGTFDSAETTACRLRIKAIGNVALDWLEKKHNVMEQPDRSIRQRIDSISQLVSRTTPG